jgi:magnesium transporter
MSDARRQRLPSRPPGRKEEKKLAQRNDYLDLARKTPQFSLLKRSSKKAGLPPGVSVHVGSQLVESTSITIIDYDEQNCTRFTPASLEECFAYRKTTATTWLNVDGLHETEIINRLGTEFGLHPLTIEDILNTAQRPKIDVYDDYVYLVVRMHSYDAGQREIMTEQVSIILGAAFVLTFQEKPGDIFDAVRDRIRTGRGKIRKMGPDYLAYSLLDSVVDSYFAVLERVGEEFELLEENLMAEPAAGILQRIHFLKREMILMRKAIWPLREVLSVLQREDIALISGAIQVYLRDLYDHTIQVIDTVETFRDMLSGMVEIYLSSVSNRLNEVMKVLTIFAGIFIPLTLIAGIYGMNFNPARSPLNMPELNWYFGYPFALGLMAAVGLLLTAIFKKKGWF